MNALRVRSAWAGSVSADDPQSGRANWQGWCTRSPVIPASSPCAAMSTDDGINTLRRALCLIQLREERSLPLVPGGDAPFFVIADARVHQNTPTGDFHYQRMDTAHGIAIRRQKWGQPRNAGQVIDRR